jgi:dipeptidyl aminopeptidase/acylaminoacyl peptidase/CubicO group peptidase (beta-lactamase class C family)
VSRPLAHDDLWSITVPSDPQLSPDGETIAFTLTCPDRESDGYRTEIWTVPYQGGDARRLTNGDNDSCARWSPAGDRLAFLRDGNIWILPVAGGEATKLTELPLGAGEPVWSPDGTRIAFSAPVSLDPSRQDSDPLVIDQLGFKADGVGLTKARRMHLFVIDAGSGPNRQITFGDLNVSTPVWSPDGRSIAYSTSTAAERDLEVAAVVHTVSPDGGVPCRLSPSAGVFHVVGWSPDGRSLLVHGQAQLRAGHDLLYSLPAAGGEPVCLLPSFDRNVMPGAPGYPGAPPQFGDGGQRIFFCARDRGAVHAFSVPAGGGTPALMAGGARVVAGLSVAGDRFAYVAATPTSSGEIWAGDKQLTHFFAEALPDVELLAPEERTFTAPDGTELHGWVLSPPDADRLAPLLLDIHGGPHNAWGPAFDGIHLYQQTLAHQGWSVLKLNPRGSDGYGEEFMRAVVGGWGLSDEGDFLAAVDAMIESGSCDPSRVVVTGYSYGGYMTCWLTSRTNRFAAAIAGGCVSNCVSLAGTSDLGRFLAQMELEASVNDSVERLFEQSPIGRVAEVNTPTLLLHGEADHRCPVGQAEEWFTALRDRRVEVEMVRYPDAGHLFILNGQPSHRIDYGRRIESWAVEHVQARPRPTRKSPRLGSKDLEQRLVALITRHKVPGATIAVLQGDEIVEAAAGVLNLGTGVDATTDSLFQIGSITKPYTATMVMQLVDEGKIDLDAPVAEVLPELRLADPDVTKTVTMRHLLTHTSGIQGDHFPDTGRGDDCMARFVASCEELGQSHPLGATMSYSNTGYGIAGRVIERVTDQTWDEALQERICKPLGLERTFTLPEEVLRYRAATGHMSAHGEALAVAPVWSLPRGCGPAGLICSTAADVVRFAELHLDGGRGVLSPRSVEAMQEPQVAIPDRYTLGTHWGLGWILFGWDRRVFGHDGNTIGQSAFLRIVPDEKIAIALLTNGGNAQDLYRDLYSVLLWELAGVTLPERPVPPATAVEPTIDVDQHVGTYERIGARIEVANRDGALWAKVTATGPLAKVMPDPVTEYRLVAIDENLYVTRPEGGAETWVPFVFYRLDDGSRYVHFGARATPKTG